MKKIMEVSIGGYSFALEEDAYYALKDYLTRFEATITDKREAKEVMEDVEARVAEIFQKERKYPTHVITIEMVNVVIEHLGEIKNESREQQYTEHTAENNDFTWGEKRFFRDLDNKMIAGVCSGLAAYLSIDVVLVRILFLVGLIFFTTTFWVYIIFWIVTKPAITIAQKLLMRGIPPTAENIKKYGMFNR